MIGSSFLQVMRTTIKAGMSSNFSGILPAVLSALECVENRCIILLALKRLHFYRIFFIFAGKKDNHSISDSFEFRPDLTTDFGVRYP